CGFHPMRYSLHEARCPSLQVKRACDHRQSDGYVREPSRGACDDHAPKNAGLHNVELLSAEQVTKDPHRSYELTRLREGENEISLEIGNSITTQPVDRRTGNIGWTLSDDGVDIMAVAVAKIAQLLDHPGPAFASAKNVTDLHVLPARIGS